MEGFIFTIFVILTLPFVFAGNGMLWVMGYTVTVDAQKVAEQIVEKEGSPRECLDIRFFSNVMGPTVSAVQNNCIYEYAKLAKDPSACELLMPSEYGMSCIGAADNTSRICTVAFERKVEWGSYLDGTREIATLGECIADDVPSIVGKQCCHISKVANLKGFDDCSPLSSERALHEECISQLALKQGQPEICDPIVETGSKVACILRAKYKSVLTTLPPPIDEKSLPQTLEYTDPTTGQNAVDHVIADHSIQ